MNTIALLVIVASLLLMLLGAAIIAAKSREPSKLSELTMDEFGTLICKGDTVDADCMKYH